MSFKRRAKTKLQKAAAKSTPVLPFAARPDKTNAVCDALRRRSAAIVVPVCPCTSMVFNFSRAQKSQYHDFCEVAVIPLAAIGVALANS